MKSSFRLLLALTPLVTTLHAAVPSTVNYQGTVYDSTGIPIGNTTAVNRKVIFRFYDASTAGTKLWTEEQTVTIYKGEFSVVLGNGTTATGTASSESRPALDTIFTSNAITRYLEIMVDNGDNAITASDTPISPRQLITTGFYTFHAQVADGIASGSDLTINPVTGTPSYYGLGWYGSGRAWNSTAVDGPVLYGNAGGALGSNASGTKNTALLWNASGQVGIGATSSFTTSNKLTLQGDDSSSPARQLIIRGNTDSNEALFLGFDTTNNRATLQSYTSVSTPTAGSLLLNPSGGNVGVGTTSPGAKLTVEGAVSATATGGFIFGTGGDTDGGLFSEGDGIVTLKTNGSERMRVNGSGVVSIGTTSAGSAGSLLHLSGDLSFANPTNGNSRGISGTVGANDFWSIYGKASADNAGSLYITTGDDGTEPIIFMQGSSERLKINWNGAVVVNDASEGASRSGSKLLVNGSIRATGSSGGIVFDERSDPQHNWEWYSSSGSAKLWYEEWGSGGNKLTVTTGGQVGIGTESPRAMLEVNGSRSYTYDRKAYLDDNNASGSDSNVKRDVSILASNDVVADEFGNTSDVRIKKDLKVTDSVLDLDLIMGLEVTDYRFKDTLGKGTRPQKKLIAQQVEVVFPQAVSRMVGVVPDIYQRADVKDGWVELATDLKAGDRVKLIGQKEEAVHGVLEVRAGAFRPDGKVDAGSLFVYGREVQDFRTVDYDAIAMLNVSATQELAKQLKEKDAKITAMAAKLAEQAQRAAAQAAEAVTEKTALQAQIAALQASGQTLEAKQTEQNAKLAALERLVTQQLEATPRAAAKNVVLQRAK